jgi:hypothetical protein
MTLEEKAEQFAAQIVPITSDNYWLIVKCFIQGYKERQREVEKERDNLHEIIVKLKLIDLKLK